MMRRFNWIGMLFACGMIAATSGTLRAEDSAAGRPLSDHRWYDRSYGLSFLVPEGTTVKSLTVDTAIMRMEDDKKIFNMSLQVKRSRSVLTLKQVADEAKIEIRGALGNNKILDVKDRKVAGLPAVVIYNSSPLADGRQIIMGQAIMQMDPQTFAILDMRSEIKNAGVSQPTFEAVLDSMEIEDPKAIAAQREAALQAGANWRRGVDLKKLHASLVPEQYYRIVDAEGRDIGYMRVRQTDEAVGGKKGVSVEMQSRIAAQQYYFDSIGTVFLSDDDSMEAWKTITTRKPQVVRGNGPQQGFQNSTESGIRTGDAITVTTDAPQGAGKRDYARPKIGYLSQVESYLLPQLLPIDRPGTYAFYFYSALEGKVGFRTDTVTPMLSGVVIETRLSPNDAPRKATYDANRKLVEKDLGGGNKMIPATAADIQRIWQNR
ncbi:MAG: hypothetical protein GC162_10685 [Planctomycetes bacterium]|nr:hypothetical protein [Planctomycetota bacterium]